MSNGKFIVVFTASRRCRHRPSSSVVVHHAAPVAVTVAIIRRAVAIAHNDIVVHCCPRQPSKSLPISIITVAVAVRHRRPCPSATLPLPSPSAIAIAVIILILRRAMVVDHSHPLFFFLVVT
jgi:hypothetical protein